MSGSYSPILVLFSLLVAILAAYTALDMAARIARTKGARAVTWLVAGTLSMGLGIWSMHFIGMLAFELPIPTGYDLALTGYSLACSLAASGLALYLVSQRHLPLPRLLLGALLMGSGIASMHYLGMAALRMQPGIQYDPAWFALSILIAVIASGAALFIAHRLRGEGRRVRALRTGASLVMGLAIVGMHYTGMAAARFPADAVCGAALLGGLDTHYLALLVIATTIAVMVIALFASLFDARMRVRTSALSDSLADANQRLRQAALHDPLTGLPNRVLLQDRIDQAISKANQRNLRVALLFLDLDGFKAVNDVHGHRMGDQLLCAVAARIRPLISTPDTLARLGADEFVIVTLVNAPEEAALLAARITTAVAKPLLIDGQELLVTASVGIALFPDDAGSERELMAHANTAMTHIKEAGRDGHTFFTAAMQVSADRQLRLLNDLRRALARNELVLFYQPKLHSGGKTVTGAEALIRWQHPELGLLAPDAFIDIAERSGLIIPIGRWVLDRACAQLKQWHLGGHPEWTVAVNLSAVQFTANDLIADVQNALTSHGVPAEKLTLEVTESTAMRDVETSLKILGELTTMGVKISIDDFGTGYSSLLYLKRLPATELKIDRAFVKDLGPEGEDASIVSSIIALGRTLQMHIVAEGVESREQQEQLQAMGCDQLQGYHFNPPLPAARFDSLYCVSDEDAPAETADTAIAH